jgi:hypothetical protein
MVIAITPSNARSIADGTHLAAILRLELESAETRARPSRDRLRKLGRRGASELLCCRANMRIAAFVLLIAACGGGGGAAMDAARDTAGDAGADAFVQESVVWLDFNGGMIKHGTGDDPGNSVSSIAIQDGTLAAWHAGSADQQQSITDVDAAISMGIENYNVRLLLAQPSETPYDRIVFGGKASALFGGGATEDLEQLSAGPIDCIAHRPHLMFVFDDAWPSPDDVANSVIGMIGLANGVPPTQDTGDCMCVADAPCTFTQMHCTFGSNADVGSQGNQCAEGATTFDEDTAFFRTFGPHLD